MQLHGHSAIVTGGASGLGAQVARELAQAGAKVTVVDINAELASNMAAEIGGIAAPCDITNAEQVSHALALAREHHGPVRILVNCAGIGGAKRLVGRDGKAMPLEDFSRIINVNLVGTFNVIRLAAADMVSQDALEDNERGVIINTASVAAFDGQIGQAGYAASKGGLTSLTLPLARDLAQFGVRVMTIAPGLFLTPLLYELPEEVQQSLGASIPFPKRLGKASEYASLVRHIVENVSLNGEVIRLDGALRLPPK